jgi:hypothetical protein
MGKSSWKFKCVRVNKWQTPEIEHLNPALDIDELKMRIGEKDRQSKERDDKTSFLNVVENGDGMKGHQKYVGSQESKV